MAGAGEREPTYHAGMPPPTPPHMHAGSPRGATRCRGSQACSGRSQGRGCGADISGSARCVGHRQRGPGGRCCCYTGRAGTDSFRGPLLAKGAQSSPRNSGHSGALEGLGDL